MKQDLLRNIKWIAWSWHCYLIMAKEAPMFLVIQKKVAELKAELMEACAEYRVWWSYERMRTR